MTNNGGRADHAHRNAAQPAAAGGLHLTISAASFDMLDSIETPTYNTPLHPADMASPHQQAHQHVPPSLLMPVGKAIARFELEAASTRCSTGHATPADGSGTPVGFVIVSPNVNRPNCNNNNSSTQMVAGMKGHKRFTLSAAASSCDDEWDMAT